MCLRTFSLDSYFAREDAALPLPSMVSAVGSELLFLENCVAAVRAPSIAACNAGDFPIFDELEPLE